MRASISVSDYEQGFRPAERGLVVEAAHHVALQQLALQPGHRVLDLGCGAGPLLQLLERQGLQPVGVDHSPQALAVARSTAATGRLVRGAATALPFASHGFDRIAALGVLGYLSADDLAMALGECSRVLARDGWLLICTGRRLNAVAATALRLRRGGRGAVRSLLHSRRTYRRCLLALGFAVEDWVQWTAAPHRWWAALARPFFATRWILAKKRASA